MLSTDWRECSSTIDAILNFRSSVVKSNWKSIAHTTFGACASAIGVVEASARLRIFADLHPATLPRARDAEPSSLLITQPMARKSAHARRNPLRAFALAQSRNHFRRSASGSSGVSLASAFRWVDRGCPTILQAKRCESPIVSWSMTTAFRLAVRLRIFQ